MIELFTILFKEKCMPPLPPVVPRSALPKDPKNEFMPHTSISWFFDQHKTISNFEYSRLKEYLDTRFNDRNVLIETSEIVLSKEYERQMYVDLSIKWTSLHVSKTSSGWSVEVNVNPCRDYNTKQKSREEAATKIQHAFRHARSMGFFSTIAKNHESLTDVADSLRNDSSKTF